MFFNLLLATCSQKYLRIILPCSTRVFYVCIELLQEEEHLKYGALILIKIKAKWMQN